MEPHQERVVKEKEALDGNIERLSAFFGGSIFRSLPPDEQDRLHEQVGYMKQYSDVLDRRIVAFGN